VALSASSAAVRKPKKLLSGKVNPSRDNPTAKPGKKIKVPIFDAKGYFS